MSHGWNEEHVAAHNARRAKQCAEADGQTSMDRSIATIERVVAAEIKRAKHASERQTLPAVLLALRLHPKVAWVERMNTGGMWAINEKSGHRQYIRFGWAGMSDITGQLRDGRRLEVEAKSDTGRPTPEQRAYIALIRHHQGVAFVARNAIDVIRELAIA